MKRSFIGITALFIFFLFSKNIFTVVEERAIEEPKSQQEIEQQIKDKTSERDKLAEQLEKAKKDEANYEKSKELLEKKAESKDPKVTDLQKERAAQLALDYGQKLSTTRTTINQITEQLPQLDQEINALQQKLAAEIQISPVQKPETYQEYLQNTLGKLSPTQKQAAILKQFSDIPKQYPDYRDQARVLKELRDFAQQSDIETKGLIVDDIDLQLERIQAEPHSKNPTNFESKNELSYKSPSDQMQIIKDAFEKVKETTDILLGKQDFTNALKELTTLNELYVTLKNRNFIDRADVPDAVKKDAHELLNTVIDLENRIITVHLDNLDKQAKDIVSMSETGVNKNAVKQLNALKETLSKLAKNVSAIINPDIGPAISRVQDLLSNIIQDFLSNIKEVKEIPPVDPEVKQMFDKIMQTEIVLDKEIKQDPSFLTKLKNFVTGTIEQVKSKIAAAVESVAEKFVIKFSKLRDVGIMANEYAKLLQESQYTLKAVASTIKTAQESHFLSAAYASLQVVAETPQLDAYIEAVKKVQPALDFVADQKIIMDYFSSGIQKLGKIFIGVGNAGVALATLMTSKVKTLAEVKEIDSMIMQERINMYKKPLSMVEAAAKFAQQPTEKKVEAALALVNNITDMTANYMSDLITWLKGQDKYQQITKNLSAAQQEFINNPTQENAQKMITIIQEIRREYERIYNKQDLAAESLKFLIKALDGYTFEDKAQAKDLIQSFFYLRELKASYLQTMRDNLDTLNKQVKELTDPTGQIISQNYVDRLKNIITSEMLIQIINYAPVIEGLSQNLNKKKAEISGQ